MSDPRAPKFLARKPYRKRRLRDLFKALPIIAAVLFCVPLLWPTGFSNGTAVLYVFGIWLFLVIVACLLAYATRQDAQTEGQESG